jgi:DNA-binding transcriptional MerR regulator
MTTETHEPDEIIELAPAEMAERTGVSIDTLRYYEREGLIDPVARAENGHRRYSGDDVLWVQVLCCLRDTGMSIEQLRHYCELGQQGDVTEPERRALLRAHRAEVEAQIDSRREALRLIDHKLSFYGQVTS